MMAITESRTARGGLRNGWGTSGGLCLLLVLLTAQGLSAAASWEYSPYRIRVWLAVAPRELPGQVRQEIIETIRQRADVEFSSTWDLDQAQPPAALAAEMALGLDRMGAARILAVEPKVLADDKLFCVRVDADARSS